MYKSKILPLFLFAAGVMVALLIFLWQNAQKQIDQQYAIINISNETVHKMRLVATMLTLARARTRQSIKLTDLNDPFEKDEIDIFIPINKTQYYFIGLVSDKNENIENNIGMMLMCAKSFELNKKLEH